MMPTFRYSPLGETNELSEAQMTRLSLQAAFGQICVVSIPDLSAGALRSVAELLTTQTKILANCSDETRIGGLGCPLVVEVADGRLLSDRAFWTLVCETFDDAFDVVEGFVRAVLAAFPNDDYEHAWDRQTGLVGEDAVYAYFDTCVWGPVELETRPAVATLERFVDLFYDWFCACDLDHEVRQHDYFVRLLELINRSLPDRSARLIAYRLCHGQYNIDQKGEKERARGWLSRNGVLKRVVDEELANLRGEVGPLGIICADCLATDEDMVAYTIAEMLDVVYGTSDARVDVFGYVRTAGGPDLAGYYAGLQDHMADLVNQRSAWADVQPLHLRLDTGFHTVRDVGAGWVRVETASESPGD